MSYKNIIFQLCNSSFHANCSSYLQLIRSSKYKRIESFSQLKSARNRVCCTQRKTIAAPNFLSGRLKGCRANQHANRKANESFDGGPTPLKHYCTRTEYEAHSTKKQRRKRVARATRWLVAYTPTLSPERKIRS